MRGVGRPAVVVVERSTGVKGEQQQQASNACSGGDMGLGADQARWEEQDTEG